MIKHLIAFLFSLALFAGSQNNTVPSRLQWMANSGYCGETSLISAGLYYGQYISQYDARILAGKHGSQTQESLLLGINDTKAAKKMHLQYEEWDTESQENTEQFLIWLKQKIVNGNPVAIGIYVNEYLFDGVTDPKAGDPDYDHIVSVTNLTTSHPLADPTYYGDDAIGFCDNGLWQNQNTPVYYFSYSSDSFQKDRAGANAADAPIYSLSNDGSNYGIAITGVADLNNDTLPIRLETDYNYENPEIPDQSNTRPPSMPLNLTITISNLEPGATYNLYRYSNLDSVPDSQFNANAAQASAHWEIQSTTTTYTQKETIQSSDTAIYRCVKACAP